MADTDAAALDEVAQATARVEAYIVEAKKALLAGPPYHGLITRDYLRAERFLEYTARASDAVVCEEVAARTALRVEERGSSALFDAYAARLLLLCWEGTEGTTVQAETDERTSREDTVVVVEAASRAVIAAAARDSYSAAFEQQRAREAAEAATRDAVARAEESQRSSIALDALAGRQDTQYAFLIEGGELFARLRWRVVQEEYSCRVAVEAEEGRVLEPIEAAMVEERAAIAQNDAAVIHRERAASAAEAVAVLVAEADLLEADAAAAKAEEVLRAETASMASGRRSTIRTLGEAVASDNVPGTAVTVHSPDDGELFPRPTTGQAIRSLQDSDSDDDGGEGNGGGNAVAEEPSSSDDDSSISEEAVDAAWAQLGVDISAAVAAA